MSTFAVTIEKVLAIEPIDGADLIEVATVKGWQCVVKKGAFNVGDLGVYFPIDSFLPIEERFEFLRKSSYKKMLDGSEGFRLKTIRLRGQISQGLMMPLYEIWPERKPNDFLLGDNVTEWLGVIKYEPQLPPSAAMLAKGAFPAFIRRTDQERIQNFPEWLEQYRDEIWEVTEKLDGSSCSLYVHDGSVGACSRNLDLKDIPQNPHWKFLHLIEEKLRRLERSIAIQGEIIGPKFQGNRYRLPEHEFHVFDIYDIQKEMYVSPEERAGLFNTIEGGIIKHVPHIATGTFEELVGVNEMKALLQYADGKSKLCETKREGLVFKSKSGTVSFKVISNEYLIKYGE